MDLYGDLEDPFFSVDGVAETSRHSTAVSNEELEALKKQNSVLAVQNSALKKNISCLFKTARLEIDRKDGVIQELEERFEVLQNAIADSAEVDSFSMFLNQAIGHMGQFRDREHVSVALSGLSSFEEAGFPVGYETVEQALIELSSGQVHCSPTQMSERLSAHVVVGSPKEGDTHNMRHRDKDHSDSVRTPHHSRHTEATNRHHSSSLDNKTMHTKDLAMFSGSLKKCHHSREDTDRNNSLPLNGKTVSTKDSAQDLRHSLWRKRLPSDRSQRSKLSERDGSISKHKESSHTRHDSSLHRSLKSSGGSEACGRSPHLLQLRSTEEHSERRRRSSPSSPERSRWYLPKHRSSQRQHRGDSSVTRHRESNTRLKHDAYSHQKRSRSRLTSVYMVRDEHSPCKGVASDGGLNANQDSLSMASDCTLGSLDDVCTHVNVECNLTTTCDSDGMEEGEVCSLSGNSNSSALCGRTNQKLLHANSSFTDADSDSVLSISDVDSNSEGDVKFELSRDHANDHEASVVCAPLASTDTHSPGLAVTPRLVNPSCDRHVASVSPQQSPNDPLVSPQEASHDPSHDQLRPCGVPHDREASEASEHTVDQSLANSESHLQASLINQLVSADGSEEELYIQSCHPSHHISLPSQQAPQLGTLRCVSPEVVAHEQSQGAVSPKVEPHEQTQEELNIVSPEPAPHQRSKAEPHHCISLPSKQEPYQPSVYPEVPSCHTKDPQISSSDPTKANIPDNEPICQERSPPCTGFESRYGSKSPVVSPQSMTHDPIVALPPLNFESQDGISDPHFDAWCKDSFSKVNDHCSMESSYIDNFLAAIPSPTTLQTSISGTFESNSEPGIDDFECGTPILGNSGGPESGLEPSTPGTPYPDSQETPKPTLYFRTPSPCHDMNGTPSPDTPSNLCSDSNGNLKPHAGSGTLKRCGTPTPGTPSTATKSMSTPCSNTCGTPEPNTTGTPCSGTPTPSASLGDMLEVGGAELTNKRDPKLEKGGVLGRGKEKKLHKENEVQKDGGELDNGANEQRGRKTPEEQITVGSRVQLCKEPNEVEEWVEVIEECVGGWKELEEGEVTDSSEDEEHIVCLDDLTNHLDMAKGWKREHEITKERSCDREGIDRRSHREKTRHSSHSAHGDVCSHLRPESRDHARGSRYNEDVQSRRRHTADEHHRSRHHHRSRSPHGHSYCSRTPDSSSRCYHHYTGRPHSRTKMEF